LSINRFYFYIVVFTVASVLLIYIFIKLPSYEDNLRDVLLRQSIDGVDASSDKLIKDIVDGRSDFVRKNSLDKKLRIKNENLLEHFQNRNILSVYIVMLLEEQLFFLMDSSKKDRGEFGDLFKPEQDEYFIKARESGNREIAIQKEIADLGFTLIKPILQEGEPPAFLVIDYTQKTYNSLISLLRVSAKTIMLSLAIVIILLYLLYSFFYIVPISKIGYIETLRLVRSIEHF
jgi:hypothetical protein